MTVLWAGLAFGVAGSLHCVAMCGPLVAALRTRMPAGPAGGARPVSIAAAYHAGRVAIYAVLGLVAGAMGESLAIRGLGRALAVAAGAVLILTVLPAAVAPLQPIGRRAGQIVGAAMAAVRRRAGHPLAAATVLGALNGLLPCGLVYAALVVALATGDRAGSAVFMVAFGMGTVPALLAVWLASSRLTRLAGRRSGLVAAAAMMLAGAILLARGLAPAMPHAPGAPDAHDGHPPVAASAAATAPHHH